MKYIANQNIGDYKIGDEVPYDIGKTWSEMYLKSPVDLINESAKKEEVKEEIKVDEVKPIAKKKGFFK